MYIEHPKQKRPSMDRQDFPHQDEQEEKMLEGPDEEMISQYSMDVLAHWRSPEYEVFEKDKSWYTYMTLALLAIISYAVYMNSPVMAITFILIGVTGYMYINKDPRIMDFMITRDGIAAGTELFDFDHIQSFWIFYEPGNKKVISLHTESHIVPYSHIPIHEEDPVKIRELLLNFIPEKKHEEGIVETVERLLRI